MSSRWAPSTSPCSGLFDAGEDERAVLGVVAVVRPGVVLLDVDRRVADAADRPPGEAAEVDDQVGGHVADARGRPPRAEDQGARAACPRRRWSPRTGP